MDRHDLDQRLSRISTHWTRIVEAHTPATDEAASARNALMQRYHGAAFRYLLGAVRDPDVAQDLSQEFALRFVRGDFRRADPGRGRFRDYVKTVLVNLVNDYHRAREAWPQRFAAGAPEPAGRRSSPEQEEQRFTESWRAELLDRAWAALAEEQSTYHAALRLRVENPDLTSGQMAAQLSQQLNKALTAEGIRKALERAHRRFADLLVAEVASTLQTPTEPELERELKELNLRQFCGPALARRGPSG